LSLYREAAEDPVSVDGLAVPVALDWAKVFVAGGEQVVGWRRHDGEGGGLVDGEGVGSFKDRSAVDHVDGVVTVVVCAVMAVTKK
jgi:hypothetical protein